MSPRRELIILVADGTMEAVFRSFFSRQFHHSLGCAPFTFDPIADITHDPLNTTDGGVHTKAQEILRPYINTHSRALVVLDQQFGAEVPAAQVQRNIEGRLTANGWQHRHAVVVIDPELEVLLWQDNPNVDRLLQHRRTPGLRAELAADGRWPADTSKPPAPKELMLSIIRNNRAGAPVAVYSKIAGAVSVAGCVDPAFHGIRDTLRGWFPKEAP